MKIKFQSYIRRRIWDATYIAMRNHFTKSEIEQNTIIIDVPIWGKDVPIRRDDFLSPNNKVLWYSNPIWANVKGHVKNLMNQHLKQIIGYDEVQEKIAKYVEEKLQESTIIPQDLRIWQKVTSGTIERFDLVQETSSSNFIVANDTEWTPLYNKSPINDLVDKLIKRYFAVYRKI